MSRDINYEDMLDYCGVDEDEARVLTVEQYNYLLKRSQALDKVLDLVRDGRGVEALQVGDSVK